MFHLSEVTMMRGKGHETTPCLLKLPPRVRCVTSAHILLAKASHMTTSYFKEVGKNNPNPMPGRKRNRVALASP
jgi:hypothetical protein